jgi:YD repeat-containing protein
MYLESTTMNSKTSNRNSRILVTCLFTIISLLGTSGFAQEGGSSDPVKVDNTPQSPNAASLGAYGDIPVNYYSGRASYSIPIYQIQAAEIQESIALSYDYSGLRIDETPSWTGLGWSLNYGGVVTRSVRGLEDISNNGFIGNNEMGKKLDDYLNNTMSVQDRYDYEVQVAEGKWDAEPDVFSFNCGGESGKFVFDSDGEIHIFPKSNVKIVPTINAGGITKFEITNTQGTRYIFDKDEVTFSTSSNDTESVFRSAWYLSKSISANGSDEIQYAYNVRPQQLPVSRSETIMKTKSESIAEVLIGNCPESPISSTFSWTTIDTQQLSSVSSEFWEIIFTEGEDRSDIDGGKTLKKIEIFNKKTSEKVKSFEFEYGYFGSSYLYLKSVKEDSKPATILNYYEEDARFPGNSATDFTYNQRDHWGYFNNSTVYSGTMIPNIWYRDGSIYRQFIGSDRNPNPAASIYGALKKITYPTGGNTQFEYEAHDFGNIDLLPASMQCGGPFTDHLYLENDGTGGPNEDIYSKTTTLTLDKESCLKINYRLKAVDLAQSGEGKSYIEIKNSLGKRMFIKSLTSIADTTNIETGQVDLPLDAGTYIVEAFTEVNVGVDCEAMVEIDYNKGDSPTKSIAGGIRVKKITSCTDNTCDDKQVKVFSYQEGDLLGFTNGPVPIDSKSTGKLFNPPAYIYSYTARNEKSNCEFFSITSFSSEPLINSKGSHVLYDKVTVYNGEFGEFGKTVHRYHNEYIPHGIEYPFVPEVYRDNKRGLPIETIQYKRTEEVGNGYVPVSKTENTYNTSNTVGKTTVHAAKAAYRAKHSQYTGMTYNTINTEIYSHHSEWIYQTGTRNVQYFNDATDSVETYEIYTYDDVEHLQMTEKLSVSGNDVFKEKRKYPNEYDASIIRNLMLGSNKITSPVEINNYKVIDGNDHLIGGMFIEYELNGTDQLPKKIYRFETEDPQQYPASNTTMDAPSNSDYKLDKSVTYDTEGKVISYIGKNDVVTSILWDEDYPQPVMQVVNAEIDEINFEDYNEFSSGYMSISNIHWTVPNAKNYLVDYNYRVNGVWLYKKPIPFTSGMAALGDAIDNVRIFPADAIPTTYIYDSKFNLVRTLDGNGVSQKYQYDDQNRLIQVVDNNDKVLKKIDYKYKLD